MSTLLEDALGLSADKDVSPEVLGLMMRHQGWLVPVHFLDSLGIDRVENIVMFDERAILPADALWLFTSRAAAERADEAARQAGGHIALGGYGSPVPGWRLFRGIGHAGCSVVTVNPSPDGYASISFDTFDVLQRWGQAVELEVALIEEVVDPMARYDALLRFDHLVALAWPDGEIVRLKITLDDGVINPLLVFTSPDHAAPLLVKLSAEDRARLHWRTIRAIDLFVHGDVLAQDAVAINAFSAGTTVLAAEARDPMHLIASWSAPPKEPR